MKTAVAMELRESLRVLTRHLELLGRDPCCEGITLTQCHAIVEIGRSQGLMLKQLASILMLDTSTVSKAVEGLVQKGLLERIPADSDRRSVTISLSQQGRVLFEQIEQDMSNRFSRILKTVTDEDCVKMVHALNTLNVAFELDKQEE